MASRKRSSNRYREMEGIMTKVLIGDGAAFLLYMFAASRVGGWTTIKGIAAFFAIAISLLGLGWLFLTREFSRRRSLWMVTVCISILACVLVSLCLGYPCPPVVSVV